MSANTVALRPTADNAAPMTSTRACSLGAGIGHSQKVNAKAMTIRKADKTKIHRQLR
jgi:hypothetical protein